MTGWPSCLGRDAEFLPAARNPGCFACCGNSRVLVATVVCNMMPTIS
jgi:hypothetical protein